MSNAYSSQNAVGRQKITTFAGRLSAQDMARPAGGPGWTVGGLLGHMAFYDIRATLLLTRWKKDGISPSPNDVDIVNDAARPLFNAVRPEAMKRIVREAAQAVDAAIDALDPGFLAQVEKDGTPVRLNRAAHREHHLEQIQKALA